MEANLNNSNVEDNEINKTDFELPNSIKEKTIIDGKFHFENRMFLLTYKTHLNKERFGRFLETNKHENKLTFPASEILVIAHENGKHKGEESAYPHTHIYVKFKSAFKYKGNGLIFDFPVEKVKDEKRIYIHPNIAIVNKVTDQAKILNYLSKEDPDCAEYAIKKKDSFNIQTNIKAIQACNKLTDALMFCKKYGDATGIKIIWEARPMDETVNPIILEHAWQNILKNEISQPKPTDKANCRKIIWIYDKVGNTGKTRLATHCSDENPEKFALIQNFGGVANCAENIYNLRQQGWTGHCLFLDLARDAENHSIYESLEHILNGRMTKTKYNCKIIKWNPGWVVVMANFRPDFGKLSSDRWDFRILKTVTSKKNGILSTDTDIKDEGGYITLITPPLKLRLPMITPGSDVYDSESDSY